MCQPLVGALLDPPGDGTTRELSFALARGHLGEVEAFDTWLHEAPDPAAAIAEQSAEYDAVVMGAPTTGRLKRLVFGSAAASVAERVDVPVITALSK